MKKTIKLLFADRDRDALQPLLEQLRAKGLRVVELTGGAGKNEVVLAVLSEAFYADGAAVDRLLGLIGAGAENVLPLQLDGAPIPDALKNALYARNIIPTAGRDDAHTAERILSAIPPSPPVLPRALISGGALLLALIVGALIWRSAQNKAVPSMASDLLEAAVSYGLTEEDLAKIEDVVIVGDQVVFLTGEELDAAIDDVQAAYGPDDELPFIYFDVDNYAVLDENDRDGNIHWYGMDSGRELGMSSYDDLRFIGLMPNLRYLSLALVDVPADRLPDLSGADKLEGVAVLSCGVDSLSWLSGSSVRDMMIRFSPIRDFGALTACEDLRLLHVDMRGTDVEADFSAFAPPALKNAALWFVDFSAVQDLSFLSSIRGLQKLQLLDPTGLRSLSGLEGLSLEDLEIVDGFDLEDISALSRLKWLKSLSIDDCPDVRDYSPIGGCTELENVMIYAGWDVRLRDASFLGELPKLKDIRLYSVDLPDLDFLRTLGQSRSSLERFDFSGTVHDFSGLSGIERYDMLGIDLYGGSLDRAVDDLADIDISYLYLRRISGLDLSVLPTVKDRLFVNDCDIRDLSSIPDAWPTWRIQLYDCANLRSLDGLQRLSGFQWVGRGVLEVTHCTNLSDWSALDGLKLDTLSVSSCFALPSFQKLSMNTLHLENISDLTDLSFLDEMEPLQFWRVELGGLDGLNNLEALRRFHGDTLIVPPQVEEQAQDLVSSGLFFNYHVAYPRGGWNLNDDEISLQSLEELQTLPDAMLRHVRSVCVVGDQLVDRESFASFETGERKLPGTGVIKEAGVFSRLSGLRELSLMAQPLADLNGVQGLGSLEVFRAESCRTLRDASALFTLQELTEISLRSTAVDSLQGIQNLYELRSLDVSDTNVTDLSELITLEKLESVTVSADMTKAIASLDGQSYSFRLEIIGS